MKVIDLLNKINNNEELPNKIRYGGEIWELDKIYKDYYCFHDLYNDCYLLAKLVREFEKVSEYLGYDLNCIWDYEGIKEEIISKEERAFEHLLNDYYSVPKTWEDYQTIKKAIKENKVLKERIANAMGYVREMANGTEEELADGKVLLEILEGIENED